MYAFNIIREHILRYFLTSLGISLCALLMLFLVSIYKGVSYGSVEYVRSSNASLWVLQEHATNILRSTSLLPAVYQNDLESVNGIESVSPVFFILASVKVRGSDATLYLTGYDPGSGSGGPPFIIKGRNIKADNEIVLDRAFAAKNRIRIGERITIRDDSLTVTGLSTGTNMFVIQYAFISLDEAHKIIGFNNVVSCYQVKARTGADVDGIKAAIYSRFKNIVIFRNDEFLNNNIEEMESGIIPLLFVVSVISAIVLTAILSLILYVSVLEKRKDFAIMKTLGSPSGFILRVVMSMSLILSSAGIVIALALFFPMVGLIEQISPEVSARTSVIQIIAVSCGVLFISLLSAILPNRRIRKIYPLEVFMQG